MAVHVGWTAGPCCRQVKNICNFFEVLDLLDLMAAFVMEDKNKNLDLGLDQWNLSIMTNTPFNK